LSIDWKKTSGVTDDWHSGFAGTFAENQDQIHVLEGTLVMKDGSKYTWGVEFEDARNAFRIAAELATLDLSILGE